MNGLLVIDKPSGPTSHDVVARMRRVLRERRIGHTGTLDPLATGVLPLVIGRATRLARFLSSSGKTYEAVIRLGSATDTGDAEGTPIGPRYAGPLPAPDVIDRALDGFRGQFLQQPPAFSAKKIEGTRSYRLARRDRDGQLFSTGAGAPPPPARTDADASPQTARHGRRRSPAPISVAVHRLEILAIAGDTVTLTLDCSAGFYVRSLAHDLGERLGIGAHLAALRRTRSGECSLSDAVLLEAAERDPGEAARRVIPLGRMLTSLPSVTLSLDAVRRAVQGRNVESRIPNPESQSQPLFVRLLDPDGDLVAIAEPEGDSGLLHPSVVLR